MIEHNLDMNYEEWQQLRYMCTQNMSNSLHSQEYADASDRLFSDLADPQARISGAIDANAVWAALTEMMFPLAWVPEDRGGAGLAAVDVGQVAESAGRHAVPELLVETVLARRWAALAGLDLAKDGPVVFAPLRHADTVGLTPSGHFEGVLSRVPAGRHTVVVLTGDGLHRITVEAAGAPGAESTVDLGGRRPESSASLPADPLIMRASAAALAACWIAGALRGLLSMTVTYAGERKAFGRSIGKFQAIQHHIALMATEVAAAEMAARVALKAIDNGTGLFEAASAKVRADEAGRIGCRIAHQVFGAIGFTIEHPLHLYTGGIDRWRDRYGSGPEWAVLLGRTALGQGGAALWPLVTDGGGFSRVMTEAAHA